MYNNIRRVYLILIPLFLFIILGELIILNNIESIFPIRRTSSITKKIMLEKFSTPPSMQIDVNKNYRAKMKTTLGDIDIQLYASNTPVTVNNFIYLAKNNFYSNSEFTRIIKGFMIQGGELVDKNLGDVAYTFKNEPITTDYSRGTIAMAQAGENTNANQFFIMQSKYTIPAKYVIFGKVIQGIDVVDAIAESPTKLVNGNAFTPAQSIKILDVIITEE